MTNFDAADYLRSRGVPNEEIAAAQADGTIPLLVLDQLIFPGGPGYDEGDLLDIAGVEPEAARALWRAMGFPAVPPDEVVFYEDDLTALKGAAPAIPLGQPAPGLLHQTRAMSAALSRIAEQTTDDLAALMHDLRAEGKNDNEIAEALVGILDTDQFERLMWYMFRRQLRAAAWRRLAPSPAEGHTAITVGFVDLVRFAAVTEEVAEEELERLIVRFEAVAHDAITDGGGRVVKMIGDAVMFVADDPARATLTAIDLVDAYARDDLLPPARAGLAVGPVLARDGDYFGPVVNLASRIVDVARTSRVVVSDELHDTLEGTDAIAFRRLPSKRLKGIGRPPLWAASRRAD